MAEPLREVPVQGSNWDSCALHLKQDRTGSVIIEGHAFIQHLRRGHYELGVDALPGMAIAAAFDELALVV